MWLEQSQQERARGSKVGEVMGRWAVRTLALTLMGWGATWSREVGRSDLGFQGHFGHCGMNGL